MYNPLLSNFPFRLPPSLKTSENLCFFIFSGGSKGNIGEKRVKKYKVSFFILAIGDLKEVTAYVKCANDG